MNNVAGQEESRRGNRLPIRETWEQKLNVPPLEGVGLTSVNNSDNHYVLHGHCPWAERAASIRCISPEPQPQCQQLSSHLISSAELSEAEGDATVIPNPHFRGEHTEAGRGTVTCLRSPWWNQHSVLNAESMSFWL